MRAVVADAGGAGRQLAQRVAGDHPIEVGIAERAERIGVGSDQELGAHAGPSTTVASATGSSAAMVAREDVEERPLTSRGVR